MRLGIVHDATAAGGGAAGVREDVTAGAATGGSGVAAGGDDDTAAGDVTVTVAGDADSLPPQAVNVDDIARMTTAEPIALHNCMIPLY